MARKQKRDTNKQIDRLRKARRKETEDEKIGIGFGDCRREKETKRTKLETAIYSRPNPIQAIRRNNLAYGESVTLYPGGGALWCAASPSTFASVLTHRRAPRGPSTEDRLQESRIPRRILPVSDHRECQKREGTSSLLDERLHGHAVCLAPCIRGTVCVRTFFPRPATLLSSDVFRYKCETSFVRTSAGVAFAAVQDAPPPLATPPIARFFGPHRSGIFARASLKCDGF